MRVSNNAISARLLQQVQDSRRMLAEAQERTGSGKKINRPSDDPTGTSRIMGLQTSIEQNQQYQRNANVAMADLTLVETNISALNDVEQRARELAVQGANGAIGASERQQIALEVSQLLKQTVAIGNTQYGGRFIFSGRKTDTAPLVLDSVVFPTTVSYTGDADVIDREISMQERISTNVTGDRLFPAVIDDLISLRDHLLANDPAGIGVDADHLGERLDDALNVRSEVGAKMNRVETVQQRLSDESTMLQGLLSNEQDADLAQSVVDLQTRETALQASLAAAGRALNLSLLDFLR